jgi:DnaJ-domain-containing protein 1
MNDFIDRFAEFLRGILGSDDAAAAGREARSRQQFVDPDLQQAWEELDDYMNTGRSDGSGKAREGRGTRTGAAGAGGARPRQAPDESLRQDYANLQVPFGADRETVLKSYKALMIKYHPDKFAGDPEKQRVALEIAKKVNQSFERIRSHGPDATGSS